MLLIIAKELQVLSNTMSKIRYSIDLTVILEIKPAKKEDKNWFTKFRTLSSEIVILLRIQIRNNWDT